MNFFTTILASTAITTGLIGAVAWLARTWIKERLTRSIKHEYDKDLEEFKSDLASSNAIDLEQLKSELSASNAVEIEQFKARIGTEYEIIKASLLRYTEKQFELYNDLWASLCDLEVCVTKLWEEANLTNLRKLARQLHDTRLKVRKSALLIEDRHFKELNYVLSEFEGFQFGKQYLIDLRKARRNEYVDEYQIHDAISNNAEIKNRLVGLLSDMMACLKRQIVKPEEPNQAN
ncbi:hypothetical protein HNR65_002132 [Desulfosalsimonas propionicica]|uniref:Uncharacterized protein n=1 Tax=Desulfosalsimonas propionicica TaxID=332175 RepID=A0A7W0C9T9_9BACT|nr:hypothetical protein [Desulfosalsimonas propionicica]MBA2881801.1 hypothetical protein [Desulfosalsimonas propionicica]